MRKLLPEKSNMADDFCLEFKKNRYITAHSMEFCTIMDSAKLQKLPMHMTLQNLKIF